MRKATRAIIASRTPMVTPIITNLLPEDSDGVNAVVDRKWMSAYCWSQAIFSYNGIHIVNG